jgi:hypothetical protein
MSLALARAATAAPRRALNTVSAALPRRAMSGGHDHHDHRVFNPPYNATGTPRECSPSGGRTGFFRDFAAPGRPAAVQGAHAALPWGSLSFLGAARPLAG